MATIRVTITVDDIADAIALFDKIKVYRSTTGEGGVYVEITGVGTRIDLVAGQSVYEYVDGAGDPDYWYKSSFFNSVSSLESSLSDAIQGSEDPLYIDVDDLRAEGLTIVAGSADEARALERIRMWQQFIENETGLFFIPRQLTLELDGTGTNLLQLAIPIISVSALYVNDDFDNALGTAYYVAYTGRGGEDGRDDRRNPRIKLVTEETSIFAGVGPLARTNAVFEVGEKNQRVEGSFGFVEPGGCTPAPIRYALTKLVVRSYPKLGLSAGGTTPGGPMIEEETDRHRRKWADPFVGAKVWTVTGDLEVDRILAKYRRPMIVKGPRTLHGRGRRSWSI
jgi:hypothetical protein